MVITLGRYDIIVELLCPNADGFVDVVNRIRMMNGVGSGETCARLACGKQSYDWGVG